MPRPLRISIVCLLVIALLIGYFAQRCIQDFAEVDSNWAFDKGEIGKARKILDEGSTVSDKPLKRLTLNQRELNLLANYLLNRYAKGDTVIGLHDDSLSVLLSLKLPPTPFGSYLNVRLILTFNQAHRQPVLSEFKIGKQHIHPRLANYLIDLFIRRSPLHRYYLLASNRVKDMELYADKIVISYHFDRGAYTETRQLLKFDTSHTAMRVYREKLIEVIDHHDPEWLVSMTDILQPLFALAAKRSTEDTAIGENRALIYTVAAYVNNQKIPTLLDTSPDTTESHRKAVYAYKRVDIPQHFMASAAISAAGNSGFADEVGLEKELHDAKGGSGFSFIDLAADRAGLRFGKIAVANGETARQLQLVMAKTSDYKALLPDISDLPEKMDEAAFIAKFGGVDSQATEAVIADIDARIGNTAIFALFKDVEE